MFSTEYEPVRIEDIQLLNDRIGYIHYDDNGYADMSGDVLGTDWTYEEYGSEYERDDAQQDSEQDGDIVFIVDVYQHSGTTLRLHSADNYTSYTRWDTAPKGLLTYVGTDYKDDPDSDELITYAENTLKTLTDYVNGEVFGVTVETINSNDQETVWGIIGYENAQQYLANLIE